MTSTRQKVRIHMQFVLKTSNRGQMDTAAYTQCDRPHDRSRPQNHILKTTLLFVRKYLAVSLARQRACTSLPETSRGKPLTAHKHLKNLGSSISLNPKLLPSSASRRYIPDKSASRSGRPVHSQPMHPSHLHPESPPQVPGS